MRKPLKLGVIQTASYYMPGLTRNQARRLLPMLREYRCAKIGYGILAQALGHLVACAVIDGDKNREDDAVRVIVEAGRGVRAIIRKHEGS